MLYAYYCINNELNTVEVYFENKPSCLIRQSLKDNDWRWNPDKQCWYNMLNQTSISFAQKLGASEVQQSKQTSKDDNRVSSFIDRETANLIKKTDFDLSNIKDKEKYLDNLDGPLPKSIYISEFSNQNSGMVVIAYSLSGKILEFGIVKNVEIQNTSKNIYWIERSISKKLIFGIVNNKPWFVFDGELCLIKFYLNCSLINEIISHSSYFLQNKSKAEIWVYTMKLPCSKHPKEVEMVTAYVPVSNLGYSCKINVYYCPVCKRYYINSYQYSEFVRKYGLPVVRLRCDESRGLVDFMLWKEESILHIMGYNVSSKDNLTDNERYEILLHALKTNTLTKAQIIAFLEFLIHKNESNINFKNACYKWNEDIKFIRKYETDKQRKVIGNFRFRD